MSQKRMSSVSCLWLAVVTGLMLGFLSAVQPAFAQEATPGQSSISDDQVNAIAKQLYCPVCENTPLDVCPTKACAQWRDEIRVMLSEGKSEQEIKDYFVRLHGVRVLAAPPASGLYWLLYIIPPIAILAGAVILYRAFREWRRATPPQPPPASREEPGDEYVMRLEEELRKR